MRAPRFLVQRDGCSTMGSRAYSMYTELCMFICVDDIRMARRVNIIIFTKYLRASWSTIKMAVGRDCCFAPWGFCCTFVACKYLSFHRHNCIHGVLCVLLYMYACVGPIWIFQIPPAGECQPI